MAHSVENTPLNTGKDLGNLQDLHQSESSSVDTRVIQESHGSSPYGAVFIVVNAALGAGLLTFPYAFYLAGGWYWGVILQLVSYVIPCCACGEYFKAFFLPSVFSRSHWQG